MSLRRLVIKEGPLVFLANVIVMELLAGLVFFGLSFLDNYEALYRGIGIDTFVRYDLFLILAFSIFQITFISGLFFQWYFSFYEIHDKEIVRRSGILFKRHKSVSIWKIATVEISQNPIERFMRHGTIILEHANGRETKIRNVENYAECADVIKRVLEHAGNESGKARYSIEKLISLGEGPRIEFKQTLRWDVRNKQMHKDIERSVLKTIVGFLNSDGGTLIIGIDDDGNPRGLEDDFATLPKKNRDGFENHISMLIKTTIGLRFRSHINIRFEKYFSNDICVVEVEPSHKPAYLLAGPDGKEEFFVRTGNSTQPFSMSDAEEYIKTRWK